MAEKSGKFTVGGVYAEYAITNAWQCITLADDVSWEKGSCSLLNPMSAIGLLDKCHEYRAKAVIQTGAAS